MVSLISASSTDEEPLTMEMKLHSSSYESWSRWHHYKSATINTNSTFNSNRNRDCLLHLGNDVSYLLWFQHEACSKWMCLDVKQWRNSNRNSIAWTTTIKIDFIITLFFKYLPCFCQILWIVTSQLTDNGMLWRIKTIQWVNKKNKYSIISSVYREKRIVSATYISVYSVVFFVKQRIIYRWNL